VHDSELEDEDCDADVDGWVGSGELSYDGSPSGPIVIGGNGSGNPGSGPPPGYIPGPGQLKSTNPPIPGGQNQQIGHGAKTG
jgi:hypothetical protein